MLKNITNMKLICFEFLLFVYSFVLFWFFDELFIIVLLLVGTPIFIIFFGYILLLFLSFKKLIEVKTISDVYPIIFLATFTFLFVVFNPATIKLNIEFKNKYDDRVNAINYIKQLDLVEENNYLKLPTQYKNLSINDEVYIHLFNKKDILIEFKIIGSFPDEGTSIIYSSVDKKKINNLVDGVNSIKKMKEHWYIVKFN